jgi:apolipoprotein D and lipocalin family protein
MVSKRTLLPLAAVSAAALALGAWLAFSRGPVGNKSVPPPAKPVDLERYAGLWYEIARYENSFERDCEAVTAEYRLRDDGLVDVLNSSRKGGLEGPRKTAKGRARAVEGSGGAMLKVSFFGPFYVGSYWVLDHADDYSWSIVGEPSGRFLWLLSRAAKPGAAVNAALRARAAELGYDLSLIRTTQH